MAEARIDSLTRGRWWKWQVCGLLLLATMIMYMDRQTLAVVSVRVTQALSLTEQQYGTLELAFGWAFAAGALLFGWLADQFNIRWLYPTALIGWSTAGILTGLSRSYEELLACRTMLGIFEAGNWPCALVITQRLLDRADRGMGNSVLQSGASFGAILTPLVVLGIFSLADPNESIRLGYLAVMGGAGVTATGEPPTVWPLPFVIVGAVGLVWVLLWFVIVPPASLKAPEEAQSAKISSASAFAFLSDRRFFVLLVMIVSITIPWQIIRAWLPKILIESRGYSESATLLFNSIYYIFADLGCLLAGAATLALARRGFDVHRSRVLVFSVMAGLTSLTVVAAVLPPGPLFLGVLTLIAAGSLGMYPCYYSFTQELTVQSMGKLSGILSFTAWLLSSPTQPFFGWLADRSGSHDIGFAVAGLSALLPIVFLLVLWYRNPGSSDAA